MIAQVAEDRGLVGMRGRRIYQLRIDEGEGEPTTIEVPEADLEPAPPLFDSPEAAEHSRFSTQNWPRQGFHVSYARTKDPANWTASLWPVHFWAVPPEGADSEFVRVDVSYDPRVCDPREYPTIWTRLTEKAGLLADVIFKSKYPRAKVTHRPADRSDRNC
jgi:hypothetical protein